MEAEIQRQKRAEQWRLLVVEEEREERERKRKIEKLQKMIDREMQRAHHRHHRNVNSDNSAMHISRSHADFKDSGKMPCSSAANVLSNPEVETDSTEQTSTPSIPIDVDIAPHDDTTTVEKVKLAITIEELDADVPLRDQLTTNASQEPSTVTEQTDQSSVSTTEETDSPDDITMAETDNHDDITTAEVDNHDDITTAERDNHDDITTAETDNHGDITTAEKDNHDDITKDLPQRTPVNTELQIQQTGVVALTQPEANPTVQLTTELQIQQTDGAVIELKPSN